MTLCFGTLVKSRATIEHGFGSIDEALRSFMLQCVRGCRLIKDAVIWGSDSSGIVAPVAPWLQLGGRVRAQQQLERISSDRIQAKESRTLIDHSNLGEAVVFQTRPGNALVPTLSAFEKSRVLINCYLI